MLRGVLCGIWWFLSFGGILVIFQSLEGIFCHFQAQGYFGFFKVSNVFRSLFRLGCILVIFLIPRGYLIHFQTLGVFWSSFQDKGVFLVIFRFRWFFGLFLGFNGILVFFQASKIYQLFSCFGSILAILWVVGVLWSFFKCFG